MKYVEEPTRHFYSFNSHTPVRPFAKFTSASGLTEPGKLTKTD